MLDLSKQWVEGCNMKGNHRMFTIAGKNLINVDLVHNSSHFSVILRYFATKARKMPRKKNRKSYFFSKKKKIGNPHKNRKWGPM